MLINFQVSNFKSILDKVSIDFSDYTSELPFFDRKELFNDGRQNINGKEYSFMKGLYSFTLSQGKTNIIKSIDFFFDFIHNSHKNNKDIPIDIINNINAHDKHTTFKAEFLLKKVMFSYELALDKNHIIYEKLERDNKIVFERQGNVIYTKNRNYSKIKKNVKTKSAFLSTAYANNVKAHLFDRVVMKHIDPSFEEELKNAIYDISCSSYIRGNINNILRNYDLGIEKIELKEFPFIKDGKEHIDYIPCVTHENNMILPIEAESSGTLKIIIFMIKLFKAIKEGGIVLIDNIEQNFHQILLENIFNFMVEHICNNKNVQIIFSSNRQTFFLDSMSPKDSYFCSIENGNQKVIPISSMKIFEKGYKKYRSLYRTASEIIFNNI